MRPRSLFLAHVAALLTGFVCGAGAAEVPPLSPRAQQLQDLMLECVGRGKSNRECPGYTEIMYHCHDRAHWPERDCQAMRDSSGWVRVMRISHEAHKAELRSRCKEGDAEACRLAACPGETNVFGTDAQVIACAKLRKQPFTDVWVQLEKDRNGRAGEHRFMCLRKTELLSELGERVPERIEFNLFPDRSNGASPTQYSDPSTRARYPSAEAAATAMCPRLIAERIESNAKVGLSRK